MATPNQKADARPISFLFHNTSMGGEAPVKVDLVIRPEDLTRPDPSRTVIHQTLGGAWLDSWGAGLPSVQISGTTGWGGGGRKDGLEEFKRLHSTIFKRWHDERESAIRNGFDPDKVKLIFCDDLDEFTWVVAPLNFVLRRNKARPLLSQYQINLGWVSDGVADRKEAEAAIAAMAESMAISKPQGFLDKVKASLSNALGKIKAFAAKIKGAIGAVLGPIQRAVAAFTELTAAALGFVQDVIATGMSIVRAVTNPLIGIASNLCRAAANVTNIVQSILSIPQRLKAEFSRVASAFTNAFCVLKNAFGGRRPLPSYDDLYGASTCSSTAGGRPISRFDTDNPFPLLLPIETGIAKVTGAAAGAINRLASLDVIVNTPQTSQIHSDMVVATTGVAFA